MDWSLRYGGSDLPEVCRHRAGHFGSPWSAAFSKKKLKRPSLLLDVIVVSPG